MSSEDDIRRLMKAGIEEGGSRKRVATALGRARRQVGQRDTIAFAMVNIWTVLARLIAPIFAAISVRQAAAIHQHSAGRKGPAENTTPQVKGESDD